VPQDEDAGESTAPDIVLSEALLGVLQSFDAIDLQPGDTFIHQGEASDAAYFVQSGSVLVYAETPYGELSLATHEAPRLVGEIGAFTGVARTASVKALTRVRVTRISRVQLLEVGQKYPDLLVSLIEQLSQQIASVSKAVALYTNALSALETRDCNEAIFEDLTNPPPQLVGFSTAFRRFADQISSKRRQQDEMASAAFIQRSLLPQDSIINAANDTIEVRATMRPARDVGGDFYDFFMLDDNRLAMVIGDVCGKGMPASLFMAVVVTVLRTAARDAPDAAAAMARANAQLCRDNSASLFATVFYAVLDLRSGVLEYCNCGHNAPIHLPASGEPRRLEATGLPLAVFDDSAASLSRTRIDPGDDLILFTDGVTEAFNPLEEEFGETFLIETLQSSRNLESAELVKRLFDRVDEFAEGEEQADDITCVVVRRHKV